MLYGASLKHLAPCRLLQQGTVNYPNQVWHVRPHSYSQGTTPSLGTPARQRIGPVCLEEPPPPCKRAAQPCLAACLLSLDGVHTPPAHPAHSPVIYDEPSVYRQADPRLWVVFVYR